MQASPSSRRRVPPAAKRLTGLFAFLALAILFCYFTMIRMPGRSYRGPLPPLTELQQQLADELKRDVQTLAIDIGPRNVFFPKAMREAADYIERELTAAGLEVERQTFEVDGVTCINLISEIQGKTQPDEIIIIGAHYDSCGDGPAANDNATGVAATLALAHRFADPTSAVALDQTIRFVLFTNEEPPYFKTPSMGSHVYAMRCRERGENIIGMLSLETIGYYSDEPRSQQFPILPIKWVYPDQGNFIAFVGNYGSRSLVKDVIGSFRKHAQFPSEGAALPGWIEGVAWSDQWSFWEAGYPALMVTDTAPYRYPYYHTAEDTPEKLDFERMARVVDGLFAVIVDLSTGM